MTALAQEIMVRVRSLPKKKQVTLLRVLSDGWHGEDYPIIAESDLTAEELSWVEEGRQERGRDPAGFVSIQDYLAETGRSVSDFRKRRVVYE